MNNNKYALFYKTDKNSTWKSKRLDFSFEQWEKYCKEQDYAEYDIKDLSKYSPFDLHLLTDVVYFENKYYLQNEEIQYPLTETKQINQLAVTMEWEDEEKFYEGDYDEVYNGVEQLWTDVTTKFSVNKDMDELGIVAQIFITDFPKFQTKLEKDKHAVYINEEYSKFKWLAWLKNDKVRLIHQDYRFEEVKTEFDILIDKKSFYQTCETMLKTMQEYAEKDKTRYENYVKEKYKR